MSPPPEPTPGLPGIRVAVVDDQELVASALAVLVGSFPGVEAVATAADGIEAVALVRAQASRGRPLDVVLMDIRMPRLDGIEATRQVRQTSPHTRVLALTTFAEDAYVRGALAAGARGYLLKDATPREMEAAIRTVAAGGVHVSPGASAPVMAMLAGNGNRPASADPVADAAPDESRRLSALTAREREVLALLGRGLTNAEIARTLSVSPTTVKTHVSSLLTKLGRRDRVALALLARDCAPRG